MPGIVDDFGARRSLVCSNIQRRRSCSLPFSPFSDDGSPRLSLSYQKLPSHIHLCNLSVLKLDGSSFDVQISGAATVAELKQAVEDVFTQSPREDQREISWSHVWGHFCLCFEGQKLINNKDYIQSFGIQDGCQLYFIRHLSINYDLMKRPSRKGIPAAKQHTITLEGSDRSEEDKLCKGVDAGDVLEENDKNCHSENNHSEDFIGYPEFKLAHFLKGWLSYTKLCCFRMKRTKRKVQPSRFSRHFMKLGSKLTFMQL